MSVPTHIEKLAIKIITEFNDRLIDIQSFISKLSGIGTEYSAFSISKSVEETIYKYIDNVSSRFDEQWYFNFMDVEKTEEGYEKIREAIMPYVENIERLIIRGTTEGEQITEEERTEWWKKQKEREREEFYKFHGYYEDEEA